MAETAEKRKKIYKLATELNLSHETLVEFLRKKGHTVKGHMSTVDDDMMKDILIHFRKDKDVAEKHHRKIQEIRGTRTKAEKKHAEATAAPTATAAPPAAPEPVQQAPPLTEAPVPQLEAAVPAEEQPALTAMPASDVEVPPQE